MTADLLIHATLTVSGDSALLPVADARIKALLVDEIFEGGFEEHHGDAALAYDFKVRGGVPFPAFALASQEFPQLAVVAEWVNVAAGRRGRARIADGRIVEHVEDSIGTGPAETPNRYCAVAAGGRLALAVAVIRRDHGLWNGYVIHHERDALFEIRRDGPAIALRVTEGGGEWARLWTLANADAPATPQMLDPAQPLDAALYDELERLARDFAAEWIWLRDAPAAETAIERDRYDRYGYAVQDANVRVAKLQRMRGDAAIDEALRYSTLDADSEWIPGLLQRCWA
jgi:hypothetical protein